MSRQQLSHVVVAGGSWSLTVSKSRFFPSVTQTSAPSKVMPTGWPPTLIVPRVLPSLAGSLVTVLLKRLPTQMFTPSKTPEGNSPTPNVPRTMPWLASSLIAVALAWFVTHMFVPSKATANGFWLTWNVLRTVPSPSRHLVNVRKPDLATHRLAPVGD